MSFISERMRIKAGDAIANGDYAINTEKFNYQTKDTKDLKVVLKALEGAKDALEAYYGKHKRLGRIVKFFDHHKILGLFGKKPVVDQMIADLSKKILGLDNEVAAQKAAEEAAKKAAEEALAEAAKKAADEAAKKAADEAAKKAADEAAKKAPEAPPAPAKKAATKPNPAAQNKKAQPEEGPKSPERIWLENFRRVQADPKFAARRLEQELDVMANDPEERKKQQEILDKILEDGRKWEAANRK